MTPSLADLSLGSIAIFAAILIALHVLRPDLDPRHRYVSEYALGRYGRLMTAAFFVLAAGGLTLAVATLRGATSLVAIGVPILLLGWTLSLIVTGWFPTDSSRSTAPLTWSGRWHNRGARWAFQAIVAAAVLRPFEVIVLGEDRLVIVALAGGLVVASYVAMTRGYRWHLPSGASQRAFLGSVLAWLVIASASV